MSDAVLVPLILGAVAGGLGLVFTVIAGGMASIYPTFQWEDHDGRVHQRTSMMRASLGPKPGAQVPVRFDPDEPSRAMIDTYVQSGRILYLIGGGLLVLSVLVLALAAAAATL